MNAKRDAKRAIAFDLATSFQDERGFIDQDERGRRVFRAALRHGMFSVIWNMRGNTRERFDTRSFPEALYLACRLILEGKRPLLTCWIHNADFTISAKAYKSESGKWIDGRNATADEYEKYLDLYADITGRERGPSPLINKLRSQGRAIKRERL